MRGSIRLLAIAIIILVLGASGYSQQNSQNRPLGDVAREDRARREQIAEQARAGKVYTNDDLPLPADSTDDAVLALGPDDAEQADAEPSGQGASTPQPVVEAPADEEENWANSERRGDREEYHDVIVVPAGTRILADMGTSQPTTHPWKGKLVMPVYVGFTTAIRDGEEVTIAAAPTYPDEDEGVGPWAVELIAVKVGDNTYDVQTSPVLLGGDHEVTFILKEPLTIYR